MSKRREISFGSTPRPPNKTGEALHDQSAALNSLNFAQFSYAIQGITLCSLWG